MNDVVNSIANVSVITKMEVLGFDGPEKNMALLEDFIDESVVFYLNE